MTAAMGAIGCMWLGARRAGHALLSALAYPAMGLMILTLMLAYSRGALVALVLGLVLWFVLVPLRLRGAAILICGVMCAGAVVAWDFSTYALKTDNLPLALRTSAGPHARYAACGSLAASTLNADLRAMSHQLAMVAQLQRVLLEELVQRLLEIVGHRRVRKHLLVGQMMLEFHRIGACEPGLPHHLLGDVEIAQMIVACFGDHVTGMRWADLAARYGDLGACSHAAWLQNSFTRGPTPTLVMMGQLNQQGRTNPRCERVRRELQKADHDGGAQQFLASGISTFGPQSPAALNDFLRCSRRERQAWRSRRERV